MKIVYNIIISKEHLKDKTMVFALQRWIQPY